MERVLIRPLPFFLKEPGFGLLTVASITILALNSSIIDIRKCAVSFWGGAAISSLIFYIGGSLSSSEYVPITLVDRMCLPVLPPLIIWLTGWVGILKNEKVQVGIHRSKWAVGALLGLCILGLSIFFFWGKTYYFALLTASYALLLITILTIKPSVISSWILPLLLFFQVGFQLARPRSSAFEEERKILMDIARSQEPCLILTDRILARLPKAHFDFHMPDHLHFAHWDTLTRLDTKAYPRKYVLVQTERVESIIGENGVIPRSFQENNGAVIYKLKSIYLKEFLD